MDLKWNKHNNMRICWTCRTWNAQSFNYRPTKLNLQTTAHTQHSNTDPTHTHTNVSTSLTHSWCDLNPNGMWTDPAVLIGWRSRKWAHSTHTAPQTTNEKHGQCQTEPIRILVHDERSRDWMINNGRLKTALSALFCETNKALFVKE